MLNDEVNKPGEGWADELAGEEMRWPQKVLEVYAHALRCDVL
jgi:hypothetical protein